MTTTPKTRGGRFEQKVSRILRNTISKELVVVRGSSQGKIFLKKTQKDPDYILKSSANTPKAAVECKYVSSKSSPASYWTQMARGYTLLNDIRIRYPRVSCFLVVNRENDSMDYSKLFRKAGIKYIVLNEQEKEFRRLLKKIK
ncbi:MAG: hypothetical protein ACE5DM_01665 [Candidatus Nanoarchaeia archaeon]